MNDTKPSTGPAEFRRFRRVRSTADMLDLFDYGLIVGLKLGSKPKPRR